MHFGTRHVKWLPFTQKKAQSNWLFIARSYSHGLINIRMHVKLPISHEYVKAMRLFLQLL